MKKMKNSILLFFIVNIIVLSCKTKDISMSDTAQDIFLKKLVFINEVVSNGSVKDYDKVTDAVLFLERLTGIKSDVYEGFISFKEPTEKNLNDWKNWYKSNKDRLYWSDSKQMVEVAPLPHNN